MTFYREMDFHPGSRQYIAYVVMFFLFFVHRSVLGSLVSISINQNSRILPEIWMGFFYERFLFTILWRVGSFNIGYWTLNTEHWTPVIVVGKAKTELDSVQLQKLLMYTYNCFNQIEALSLNMNEIYMFSKEHRKQRLLYSIPLKMLKLKFLSFHPFWYDSIALCRQSKNVQFFMYYTVWYFSIFGFELAFGFDENCHELCLGYSLIWNNLHSCCLCAVIVHIFHCVSTIQATAARFSIKLFDWYYRKPFCAVKSKAKQKPSYIC